MKRLRLYGPALALLLWSGCMDTSGCLDVTSINNNDNANGAPTPTPAATPTPFPPLPTGAPCSDNYTCASLACVAGACL